MKDEPKISFLCCVDDEILVDSEEITRSDTLSLVGLLPSIGDLLSDQFSNVFDDHFSDRNMSTSNLVSAAQQRRERRGLTRERTIHNRESQISKN